jgi:hypothetical protein
LTRLLSKVTSARRAIGLSDKAERRPKIYPHQKDFFETQNRGQARPSEAKTLGKTKSSPSEKFCEQRSYGPLVRWGLSMDVRLAQ